MDMIQTGTNTSQDSCQPPGMISKRQPRTPKVVTTRNSGSRHQIDTTPIVCRTKPMICPENYAQIPSIRQPHQRGRPSSPWRRNPRSLCRTTSRPCPCAPRRGGSKSGPPKCGAARFACTSWPRRNALFYQVLSPVSRFAAGTPPQHFCCLLIGQNRDMLQAELVKLPST